MRVFSASLYVVLATSSLTADAFVVPQRSSSLREIDSSKQQPLFRTLPIHTAKATTVLYAQSDNDESQEGKAPRPVVGVDKVAAEAEAAIKEAEIALQNLNIKQAPDAPDQLIDVDQVADADEKETLATGKLAAAEDVTTKLIEKQNDIQENKRRQVAVAEQRKVEAAELEARKRADSLTGEAINSAFGAAAFGAIAGAALDIYFMTSGIDIGPAIPPLALGISLGAAAFGIGKQDNEIGQATRSIIGGSVSSVADSIASSVSNAVDSAVDDAKAIPANIKNAVDKKIEETTEEIKQIPDKVKDAAIEAAEEITGELKQIPDKVKDAAIQSADRTKTEIETAAKKAVDEVKATPGRVVKVTKEAVAKTVEDVEDKIEKAVEDVEDKIEKAVEEAVALPKKTLDDITDAVSNIIPGETEQAKSRQLPTSPDMVPKPPEMPPPPSLLKQLEKDSLAAAPPKKKPPLPKPSTPKTILPKVSVPKIKVPKISMPKPVKAKAASPQPPKEAKKKVEDFVFSEVSLKNLINKDLINKEKTTVDKPIEDKRPNLAKIQKKQEADVKQKQALEERAQKRKETELAAAVKKKQAAEQRKAATEDRADAQEKRAADLRAKRAESIVDKAKPGATISLGFFGFGQQKDDEDSKSVTGAPAGVPTLSNWVQDVDGSIIGSISGSTSFRTGESITTSSITTRDPSADSVVQTKSGSRYYLAAKKGSLGGGFFGASSKVATSIDPKEDTQAKAKQIAEAKRAAAAEARRQQAEERKSQADAKRREAEEKRQAAIAARKQDEAKKQAEKKVSSSTGGTISLGASNQKKVEVQKAEKAISKAKPGATISLGFFNFGKNEDQASTSQSTQQDTQAKTKELAEKRKAAAEASRREAEERRVAAAEAAEAKRREAQEKRIAKQEVAAARKREAEEKRQASVAVAEERKAAAATAAEARRQAQAKKSEDAISEAKPRQTISLGFLNFGGSDNESSSATNTSSVAPRGVPTVIRWRQNRDKSITGLISGSNAYNDGESITTSPIIGDAVDNAVVQTSSGSKYFLAPKASRPAFQKNPPATKSVPLSKTKAKKAEKVIEKAKPGATISLGFFNFGGTDAESTMTTSSDAGTKATPRVVSKAPRGVPSLSKWRQNRDDSMTGLISGSRAYEDGESITTSPITSTAVDGGVVQTISGSRYFLTPKSTKPVTRSGGAFGSTQKPQKTTPSALADSRKKKTEEKKKAAAAEARKQQAEERRKAALAAAEKKKASAVAAAEARKQQAEERRQAALTAAEARKQQAEEKRQASLVAIEARRKEAEEKRAAASAATQKQAQAKKAQKVVSGAKSRSTISLGFLNFGKSDDDDSSQSSPAGTGKKAPKIVSTAPRGVPTLFRWRQNRDGSITGAISGSNSFTDGESITSSPITTDSADGALVQTTSGSKYYLAPKGSKPPASSPPKPAAARTVSLQNKPAAKVSPAPKKVAAPKKMAAPRGVPKLVKWRQNRNKSITGFISGSPNFDEGERITTSAITSGTVEAGQVVKTGSGSRYYLV